MPHILVIDDMAVFRKPVAQALSEAGMSVATAVDGLDALEKVEEQKPDLILCDMAMPNMDGKTFVKTIKRFKHLQDIPVIIFTALASRETVMELLKLGIKDYVLKSNLHLPSLVDKIQRMFDPARDTTDRKPLPSSGEMPALRRIKVLGVNESQLKSHEMAMDMAAVEAACEAEKGLIEQFSPAIAMLARLLTDPSVDIEQIVEVIQTDHHLALKVVRIANSAAYTRGGRMVTGLKEGVMRIGTGKIGEALRSLGVVDHFLRRDPLAMVDAGMFWEHSVAVGLLACEFANLLKIPDAEIFFTSGILHDIGKLVLFHREWSRYGYVFDRSDTLKVPVNLLERYTMPCGHGAAINSLLSNWGYGDQVVSMIAHHHDNLQELSELPTKDARNAAILALSNHLAHALLIGYSYNEFLYPLQDWYDFLGIDNAHAAPIIKRVPAQALDIKLALLSQLHAQDWDQYDETVRKQIEGQVVPLVVSLFGEADPFAMFCQRLHPYHGDKTPNCAIVHVEDSDRLEEQLAELQHLEQKHGVSQLPTILLTPAASLSVHETFLNGRTTLVNRTPVATETLVSLLNIALKRKRAGSHG
ncbi:MAG: HDOD domain-containing protein [Planctomycetota bacterium]|jgi:CheY-like chemotaxis protein/HD-like signal output (HDOD) protein|nr:HDOD domain-containing protein [Planctomycetota bacterium]